MLNKYIQKLAITNLSEVTKIKKFDNSFWGGSRLEMEGGGGRVGGGGGVKVERRSQERIQGFQVFS